MKTTIEGEMPAPDGRKFTAVRTMPDSVASGLSGAQWTITVDNRELPTRYEPAFVDSGQLHPFAPESVEPDEPAKTDEEWVLLAIQEHIREYAPLEV